MYSKPFDGSIWTPSRYSNVDAIFDDTDDIIFSLFKYQNFYLGLGQVRDRFGSDLGQGSVRFRAGSGQVRCMLRPGVEGLEPGLDLV